VATHVNDYQTRGTTVMNKRLLQAACLLLIVPGSAGHPRTVGGISPKVVIGEKSKQR